MSGPTAKALLALAEGPKTNAQLQDALDTHHGDIARLMSHLRKTGRVKRVDGASGSGTIATYALVQ